ncbi:MAG: tetratricopeptide repeat protein, partial [Bacteroidota bacterium]
MKILLLIFLLLPCAIFAQEESAKVDSLLRIVAIEENDSSKIMLYFQVVEELMYNDPRRGLFYTQEAKKIAAREESFTELYYFGMLYTAILHTYLNEYELAAQRYDSLLNLAAALKDSTSLAQAYMTIGGIEAGLRHHEVAMEYYMKSIEVAESINDSEIVWTGMYNMAGMQLETEQWEDAISRFRDSYRQVDAIKNISSEEKSTRKADALVVVAYCFNQMGDYDSALVNLYPAIYVLDSLESYYTLTDALYNVAEAHNELGNYDSALYYYRYSMKAEKTYNKEAITFSSDYNGMGYVFLKMSQLDSAEYYLQRAYEGLEQTNHTDKRAKNYSYLAQLYEKKGNYKKAYQFAQLHKIAADSIVDEERTEQIDRLQTQFNV